MERTYKMIGGDGIEYGPASLEELLAWVREGRVAPATPIRRSDEDRWTAASELDELEDEMEKLPPFEGPLPALFPAGALVRFAAYLIDQLAIGLLVPLFATPPAIPPGTTWTEMLRIIEEAHGFALAGLVVAAVYYTMLTGQFGATIGKLILRIRVVRADGSPVGFGRAALRCLAWIVTGAIVPIGWLWIVVRADKRALHDLIAGTRAVSWSANRSASDEE